MDWKWLLTPPLPRSFYLSVYLYLSRCLAGETALSSGRKQPGDLFWELSQSQSPACCAYPIRCRRQPISRYRSPKLQCLNIRAQELQINKAERDLVTSHLTKLSQRRYMAWISQSPSWKIKMWIIKQSFEVYTSSLMGKGSLLFLLRASPLCCDPFFLHLPKSLLPLLWMPRRWFFNFNNLSLCSLTSHSITQPLQKLEQHLTHVWIRYLNWSRLDNKNDHGHLLFIKSKHRPRFFS